MLDQLKQVNSEVKDYNKNLKTVISNEFNKRKQKILKERNVLAAIGIPLKNRDDVPQTFAIPTPSIRKKISIEKPRVSNKPFTPHPTLDNNAYDKILQIIHDVGKNFERTPSVYKGKKEEDLRDFFLFNLATHFSGTATGETFNKNGKTDILLRHESTNVFIAECKFWKGKVGFLKTISQLLGYLTWRDSKAAVIMFVENKDLSNVLSVAKETIKNHENYIDFVNEQDETWLNYHFHIPGDRNRLVRLAVLFYHLP